MIPQGDAGAPRFRVTDTATVGGKCRKAGPFRSCGGQVREPVQDLVVISAGEDRVQRLKDYAKFVVSNIAFSTVSRSLDLLSSQVTEYADAAKAHASLDIKFKPFMLAAPANDL